MFLLVSIIPLVLSEKFTLTKIVDQYLPGPEPAPHRLLAIYVPHKIPEYNVSYVPEQDFLTEFRQVAFMIGFNLSLFKRNNVYVGPGTEHYTGSPLFLDGNYWENASFFMSKSPIDNPTLLALTISNIDSQKNNLCPCQKNYVCIQPTELLPPFCIPEISENKIVHDTILQVNILVFVIVCGALFFIYSY